ncbi:MAG: SLC13 family permease, partial [Thermodesulfobacteriota bacterium]
ADAFGRLAGGERRGAVIVGMLLAIGVISAFINNTAAVVMFMPVLIAMSARLETSPSKLLMPMSFVSMFGGVCTLIGTSTNILVSSIAERQGEGGFSMFEFTPMGLVFLVTGLAYMMAASRLVPARRKLESFADYFQVNEYLTDVTLDPEFAYLGQTLEEMRENWERDLEVIRIFRDGQVPAGHQTGLILKSGDVLRVRGTPDQLDRLVQEENVSLKPVHALGAHQYDEVLKEGNYVLVEGVIAPDSDLESRTPGEISFPERFGAVVLGIRRRGRLQEKNLKEITLSGGDSLLLTLSHDHLSALRNEPAFVFVSDVSVNRPRTERMPVALAILVGVVASASLDLLPFVAAALSGAVLLVLTGCLSSREAYRSINWKVLFLLGGIIPLGVALDKTGGVRIVSESILSVLGEWGPRAVLSGFFLVTMLLTVMISNQATAALLAPMGIQVAGQLDVSSQPFLMGITFAASLSFLTPMGYQTNTLIYGPGHYRFTDFTRVGSGLNLIFWILGTLLVPVFWPF